MSAEAQMNASTADLRRRGFSDADIAANKIPKADQKARAGFVRDMGGGGSSGGGTSTASDPVIRAGEDVLGRTISTDSAEYMELRNLGSYASMTRHLSISAEARRRGVNPLDWGNSVVDPETLTGRRRANYDAWSQYNSGPYYSGNQEYMGWVTHRGSLDVYHAEQQGLIQNTHQQNEDGSWMPMTIVSQEAVDRFGADNLRFSGRRAGTAIIAPPGVFVDGDRSEQMQTLGADTPYEGFVVHGTIGNLSSGFFDSARSRLADWTGIKEFDSDFARFMTGEIIPMTGRALGIRELEEHGHFMQDPLNSATGLLYGEAAARQNTMSAEQLGANFGMKHGHASKVQQVGQAVAAIVGTYYGGPWVGAAIASQMAANRAASGHGEWRDAAITAATAFATAGVASQFQNLGAIRQAGMSAGIAGGASLAQGNSPSEAFEDAAWAGASSYAGGRVNAAIGSDSAAVAFATAAGMSYGVQGLRTGDWSDEGLFLSAGLSGVSGAANHMGGTARLEERNAARVAEGLDPLPRYENDTLWGRVSGGHRGSFRFAPDSAADRFRYPSDPGLDRAALRDFRQHPPRRSSGGTVRRADAYLGEGTRRHHHLDIDAFTPTDTTVEEIEQFI